MIISPILNSSNFYYSKSYVKTKQTITFKGQVDDEFFKAVKAGDVSKQLKCLSNIGFDINGYDIETGDNFLHSAIKTGNKQIVNKAIILLGQKTNNHPELANNILNQCNNENKPTILFETFISLSQKSSMTNVKGNERPYETPTRAFFM